MTGHSDSEITFSPGGTTYSGQDAVSVVAMYALVSSLNLWHRCGMIPTRGYGISKMLARATAWTGKKYPRNKNGAWQAAGDVKMLADELKAAIPQRVIE
jgi:hypothetical protein